MKKYFYSIFAIAAISMMSCGAQDADATEGTETPKEGNEKTEAPEGISGTYSTVEGSTIIWKSKHYKDADYVHIGSVPVSGNIIVDNNQIVGGEFSIDVLNVDEEGDSEYNQMLEGHLKSPDFFNVAETPVATVKITGSENGKVNAVLSVLGVEQNVTIDAVSAFSENEATVEGSTTFNMLVYNMPYFIQSESVEEDKKGDSANPDILIEINLEMVK